MFKNIIAGALIGIANIIPGVSGGTVALLLGVYSKLTEAIGEFLTASKEKKVEFIKFLIPILVGVIIGLVGFAKVISFLYTNYKQPTSFFFLGLILASLPLVLSHREGSVITKGNKLWFFIGILTMVGFIAIQYYYGGRSEVKEVSSNITTTFTGAHISFSYGIKLIIAGALAGGAMVVPGISGSLLLVIIGEYYNVLEFINNRQILPISFVGLGAIIGIIGFAKIIDHLLKTNKDNTLFYIVGLILISLVELWPGFSLTLIDILINLSSFIVGVIIVYFMKKLDARKDG